MFASDYLLAVVLLTAAPGSSESANQAALFQSLCVPVQVVAIQWEILDPREVRYVLTRPEDFSADLKLLWRRYQDLVQKETGKPFPSDPLDQLRLAIEAVFRSWNNDRAITYRDYYKIPHNLGTAVNVQTMAFGNMGEGSALLLPLR